WRSSYRKLMLNKWQKRLNKTPSKLQFLVRIGNLLHERKSELRLMSKELKQNRPSSTGSVTRAVEWKTKDQAQKTHVSPKGTELIQGSPEAKKLELLEL